jgi:hypothetical protein
MLRLVTIAVAATMAVAIGVPAFAQGGYLPGVFVASTHGPIELTAYAEVVSSGQLQMAKGSLENVPTLSEIQRILCNVPNWRPARVLIASQEIFNDERAERRELPFAVRRMNISAIELRVEDLERKDRLAELIRGVRGSQQSPVFVFVVMATNGLSRFYPFRVRLD